MACRKYSPWHQKDGNKSSSGCDNDCMVGWSELKLGRLARQLSGESILCIILATVDWLRRTFSNLIKHLTLVSLGVQQTFDIRLQYSDFGWWHEHMLPWMLRAWLSKKKKKAVQKNCFSWCALCMKMPQFSTPRCARAWRKQPPQTSLELEKGGCCSETRTGQMLANMGARAQHPPVEGRSP